MTTITEFQDLVENHDVTYAYSDDHRAYQKGHLEWVAIKKAAADLEAQSVPREVIAKVWNDVMDRTFRPGYAENFYWKGQNSV